MGINHTFKGYTDFPEICIVELDNGDTCNAEIWEHQHIIDAQAENIERAERAEKILTSYARMTGAEDEYSLTDLLTDLRHLADKNNLDFAQAIRISEDHHFEETSFL